MVTGEYQVATLKTKRAGILLLTVPQKIQCEFLSTKVEVKGDVLGLIEPINTNTTKFTISLKAKEGKQEFTEFENNIEETKLEASVNGGAYSGVTEEAVEVKSRRQMKPKLSLRRLG